MNVEMSQMVLSIYELALRERLKNDGMAQFCTQVNCALPYLVLPVALEPYVAPEELYFLWDDAIPHRRHGMSYPERVDEYVDAQKHPVDETKIIGRRTDFDLFAVKNLMHSNYHELKVSLLVHDMFYGFLAERVKAHRNSELSTEEMKAEIEVFMNAVLIRIAETMKKRYDFDPKEVRSYAYNSLVAASTDDVQPTIMVETMLRAISTPDSIRGQLAVGDYRLDKFNSKLFENLELDTMKFLAKTYELVYAEI